MSENLGIQETHYNDVMVIVGFGQVQIRILITCGLLLMFTVTETMGMAIIIPSSACDFGTTELTKAITQSAAFIGMVTASYAWGYYCDQIGRRTVLLRSTAMAIVCSFSSMLMTNFWVFLTLRFMTGLCVAGPGFAALTYLGEFCTSKNRAPIINYMCMFNGVAMIYCPGLAQMMVNYKLYIPIIGNLVIRSWRVLGILFSAPGWLSLLSLLYLPESPKFLLLVHRDEECWEELNWLCRLNNDGKDLESFGVTSIRPLLKATARRHPNILRAMAREVVPLFHNPYVKRFLNSCIVMFGLVLVANGVAIWFTDIRNHTLIWEQHTKNNSKNAITVCETISYHKEIKKESKKCNDEILAFWDSIFLGVSFLIEYLIFGLMLLSIPRKPLFCITLTISGISGLTLPFSNNPHIVHLTFIAFLSIPAVIINLMSSAVLEFIPTYLRGKAMCICMMFGRMGAVTGTTIMGNLIESSCLEAFIIFSMFPFICAIVGLCLPLDEHIFG